MWFDFSLVFTLFYYFILFYRGSLITQAGLKLCSQGWLLSPLPLLPECGHCWHIPPWFSHTFEKNTFCQTLASNLPFLQAWGQAAHTATPVKQRLSENTGVVSPLFPSIPALQDLYNPPKIFAYKWDGPEVVGLPTSTLQPLVSWLLALASAEGFTHQYCVFHSLRSSATSCVCFQVVDQIP